MFGGCVYMCVPPACNGGQPRLYKKFRVPSSMAICTSRATEDRFHIIEIISISLFLLSSSGLSSFSLV